MKKITVVIISLLLAGMLMAQQDTTMAKPEKNGRFILDFNAGYSMPFGKYTHTDRDEDFAGYASNGFFVKASGNWLGRHSFGIAASYCFQSNNIQSNADTITPAGHYEPLGKKAWTNHYLMAGPVLIKSFGKFTLTVKVLAGGVLSFSPLFRIWIPSLDSLNPEAITLSEGPGIGVAVQTLAGIGYHLTDNLTLNLSFSYLGANPARTKDYYYYVEDKDPETGSTRLVYQGGERHVKKRISTFNIGLGIAIKI